MLASLQVLIDPLSMFAVQKDVLLFRSVRVQKSMSPGTLTEGRGGLYSVKLNGPPPESISVSLDESDSFTK